MAGRLYAVKQQQKGSQLTDAERKAVKNDKSDKPVKPVKKG